MPLLEVTDLRTYFHTRRGVYRAVDGVSFSLEKGETLGIVGESGSGKSVTCATLLGLIPQPPGRIESGRALFDGTDLLHCSPSELRAIRGKRIAMVFQDPMTSLNPYLRIAEQLIEPLLIHEKVSKTDALARGRAMLEAVGIPDAAKRLHSYPHEFSGGMRQRVMIAMALITKPDLLIADEPTTALDVTVQAQILELLKKLQRELGMAVIFVTHDLAVVSGLCDRVQVMYAGRIVESADTRTLFRAPQHPYTKALQRCIPALQDKGRELFTIPGLPPDLSKPFTEAELLKRFDLPAEKSPAAAAPHAIGRETVISVQAVETHFPIESGFLFRKQTGTVKAVDGVSFEVRRGEVLGLVGESGSGKSTLARAIMQLVPVTAGTVVLGSRNLTAASAAEIQAARRDLQMVFQDPFASLNPRLTVYATLAEPLLVHGVVPPDQVPARVAQLMEQVGLAPRFMQKYPHEFSGGQRQRIAIARALALRPKVIIADEPVSALDVSIQAQILNLLAGLVRTMDLTMIFIAHDLSVVKHVSDRIAVMYQGQIVELGSALDIMERPQHPYTRALIGAIPHVAR
ncbi:ABC transporter ATP-binding protein [Opitutus sp. GAS368]|jgi:oligopeptide/dipeptide ABC transporter ATP-binding protein|uniref:ABC transporter ATP-binding protein n=1 Tax=Opitutus sp. GAS368 TaxID=1882749 RepID=UPI000879A99B|nr:ABC transporter ATP-binding protein [Opitutus sp. GAS368]SDR66578.1 peptide/nickel transport system ATP-binding protein/oligopeptide transport system ATP-binding protein [Opitutus sp. GAS368]